MEKDILINYLQGTPDDTSSAEAEKWISASDENLKTAEHLYALLFVGNRLRAKKEADAENAFREFQRRKSAKPVSQKPKRTVLWKRVAAIAAVFVFALLSTTVIALVLLERNTQPVLVFTQLGERAQVTLPDGSKVWLNAFSSLKYKKTYLSRKRKAELSGEAYFEVARNKHFPFVLLHENSEIGVLGTKFNVRCNDDDGFLSTTLLNGSIAFSNTDASVRTILKPGEELVFNKTTREVSVKKHAAPEEVLGWIDGKLIFENASLQEIAKSLERHYNVHIYFADENVKSERFNAEFEMADNIYQILSILELTNKFTYKIEKREVIISQK